MNATELAQAMLNWQQKAIELQELEDEIKSAVLKIGKTQVVGRARATFYNPKKTYEYQDAAMDRNVSAATIELFTTVKTIVDWRGICQHEEIEDIPFSEEPARVALKLED